MSIAKDQAQDILDRLAFYLEQWGNPSLLLEIEAVLLRATEPPYNVKIPMER